jgi:hypothetical protein
MGPVLGLDTGRALAVVHLRRGLEEAGRAPRVIDRLTRTYAARLLRQRAMTIARTEVLTALNAGQRLAWEQAVDHGLLTSTATRVWITTPDDRLCPRCKAQDGLTALVGEPYLLNAPEVGETEGPPLHPSCRCAEGITEPR